MAIGGGSEQSGAGCPAYGERVHDVSGEGGAGMLHPRGQGHPQVELIAEGWERDFPPTEPGATHG